MKFLACKAIKGLLNSQLIYFILFIEAAATEILDNAIAVGEASGEADKKDDDLNFDEQKKDKEDGTTQSSNESSNEDASATETDR